MDYSKTLTMLDERDIAKVAALKRMILASNRSEEDKQSWLDSLDGYLDTKRKAYENARQALEEAFAKRKLI